MVIKLDERTMESFAPLIPEAMRDYAGSGEAFCLGSVIEETAAGVLVFSVNEGMGKSGNVCAMIELLWIYTAEEFRQRGVANELMEALSDLLDDNPAEGIICYIPSDGRYSLAGSYLDSWGFDFEDRDTPVMIITKEDCRTQVREVDKERALSLAGEIKKTEDLVSVGEISKMKFRKAIRKMLEDEEPENALLVSEDRDTYDPKSSFAMIRDGEVSSVVLFEKRRTYELHLVKLDALSSADPKELLTLLHYAAGSYYLNEPEETVVWFALMTEKSMNLAKHIFPGKDIILVKRGFYYK